MTDLAMDYAQDVAPKVPSMRWADLTPPPAEDKNYKVEVTIEDPTPQTTPTSTAINGFLLPKSNPTSRTGSPNPRKTIKWHGRNVVIQIPSETSFGVPGGRPMPLNKLQVEERMREWIERGYSIEIGGQGASRDVYPEERKEKVEASDIFVSIPDRRGT